MAHLFPCTNEIAGRSFEKLTTQRKNIFRTTLRTLLAVWVTMCVPAAWAAQIQSYTTLAISATSVPYQTPITLTASVTDGTNAVTAGLVLFCDATAAVCENNSALGLAQLTKAGTATLKLGSGPLGDHQYKAIYRANSSYTTSVSTPVKYTVVGTYSSVTTVSSTLTPGTYLYTLTSLVAGIGSVFTGPTGTVQFLDTSTGGSQLGIKPLGTAVLSNTFAEAPGSPFAIATDTTTRRSVAIASAYLDGDNNLDVVTGDYAQTITVLLGNGDGTFKAKVTYQGCPSGAALKILLADFNRDGNTDVALGCSDGTNGSLTIILGNGDGTFKAPVSYTAADVAGIAIGDFNNDGIFDIVVSNHLQQNIMLFTGVGDGTFNAEVTVLSPTAELHDVVVADFDGNGDDDLLYAVNTSTPGSQLSDLYLATGVGNGTFNTPALIASKVGEFLAAGDTNGDGLPDVVSTTITGTPPNVGNSLFVILNNNTGAGKFFPTVTYLSDIPSDPHLADVNGDGKPDIIAGGSYGELVYQGKGDGTFLPYTEPTIGDFALTYAVNAGDYNNDGNADLIGTDADTPRAAVSLSQVEQSATAAALTGVAVLPLGSGTHQVDAAYSGDPIYQTSTSTTIPLLAAPTPTTLVLTVSPTSATLAGTSVALTATLSPYTVGPPTTTTDGEKVKFYDGTTLIGQRTLAGGVATFTTTHLPGGTDAITAVFPGDANYETSTSGSLNVTVAAIIIASSQNPSSYLQSVTFTASVAPSATGTVTFMDGTTVLGTSTISSGKATYTTSNLAVTLHNITGVYSGDGSHSGATSPVLVQEVDKATVNPTVTAVPGPSTTYGTTVTITATLPTTATGTVTITSGGVTIGTGQLGSNGTFTVTTSSLPVGPDTITASYGGDGNYNATSGSTSETVGKNSPTLTAPVVNPTNPVTGSQVTITETVPSGVSGPVTFSNGTTTLGSAPVVGGTATLTVPSLPAGTDTITASTPGDTNNNPATSPVTTVTVTKIDPTVTVTATGPGTYGSTETITVTVPPGTTGTVTVTSGGTTLGSGTVSPTGTVTITTTSLPAGNDPITASYGGDNSNNPETGTTSVTISQSVPPITVSTTGPSTFGNPVTVTATLPPGTTGTVTFTSGGTTIGTGTVGPTGTATVTTSTLPVGGDPITASYGGDSNNLPTTGTTTQTVTKASPTVTLISSSNPSTATQPVTFTATVPTNATGTVTFSDNGTPIGTGTITNGVATVTTSTLPSGSDTITASYSGDSNNNSSTSTPLTQTVNKNSPTLPPPGVSSTNVNDTTAVTITETVPSGVSGPVTFYDGGVPIGTGTVVGGVATLTVPSLPVGSDQITASTPGDANNNSATSPATTVTVTKTTPTLPPPSVSSTNPSLGTPVTITETVPTGVTGPVTFSEGGVTIGTAPVNNGVATITTSTLPLGNDPITASTPANSTYNSATSPPTNVDVAKGVGSVTLTSSANPASLNQSVTFTAVVNSGATGTITFYDGVTVIGMGTINSAGVATLMTSGLSSGTHLITALFGGDSSYSSATSPVLSQVVNRVATTIVVMESSPMQLLNGMVTFTANVTAQSPTPTGTVTFFDGGTAIGTSPMNTNGTAVVSLSQEGSAAFATSSLTTGTHQITATYSGDTGFMPSTSLPVTNVVADFTNKATGTLMQKLFPGDSTSYTFVLTPVGSSTFLSDTAVEVDGLPTGTVYQLSTALIPAGSGPTTVTLKLTTSPTLKAANHAPGGPGSSNVPASLAVLGLLGMGAIRRYRKQMPRMMLLALLMLASLLPIAAMTGCAGGYFALDPTNYNVKLTGTEGPIQHSATTTLVVQ